MVASYIGITISHEIRTPSFSPICHKGPFCWFCCSSSNFSGFFQGANKRCVWRRRLDAILYHLSLVFIDPFFLDAWCGGQIFSRKKIERWKLPMEQYQTTAYPWKTWWLEDEISFKMVPFFGDMLIFGGVGGVFLPDFISCFCPGTLGKWFQVSHLAYFSPFCVGYHHLEQHFPFENSPQPPGNSWPYYRCINHHDPKKKSLMPWGGEPLDCRDSWGIHQ